MNTDIFDCKVTVAKNGKVIRKASLATAVAPLSEETYALPLAKEEKPGEYAVTVSFHLKEDKAWAEAGHEVAFGQYVYQVEKPKKTCPEGVKVIRSTHNIGVRGAHFEVLFSVLNGGLVSYKYAGKEMIEAIPKPNFWRAPTDNDCGNLMGMRYGQWKIASMYLSHKDFRQGPYGPGNEPEVEVNEKTVKVTYTYLMPTTPLSECRLSYEVSGDGRVKTTLSYDPVKELGDMPEFGVIFKFNADYDRVEWYGLGEAETYSDRKKGAKLGIYANKVADNIARYMVPQECGAKEEVRWAKVTDRKGRGMLFEMDENNGPLRMRWKMQCIHTNFRRFITLLYVLQKTRWESVEMTAGEHAHTKNIYWKPIKRWNFPLYLKDFKRRQHGETDEIRTLPSWWRL